ncbi:Nucleoporin nup44 [Leucoagaricus sp. SymC.cos]|nr:Nucleoporin nup44 [Leucoagaricus sp. SymC.cos]
MSLFGALANNQSTTPATGSIFGNTQQQQQQPAGGLFGNTQPAGQVTLFGNTNPQQSQPTTSIFGAANTNTGAGTGGSLFGNTSNATQPATGGTSLFGNTNPTGTSLFGNMQTQQQQQQQGTTPSLFGNTTGGSIFGNMQTQQQQQPATGTSLFGNTATTTTQPATGGSLFGNTATNTAQQPATGGSLFGSTTTNQPATGGSFLFGNTGTTTGTTQQQPSSLFGNKPGGLFGSTTTGTNTGGGLFGNTQTQQQGQQQQQQPSLFGNTNTQPATNPFGSTQQQQQPAAATGSLFGTKPQNGSYFGSTAGTGSAFNASTLPSSSLLGTRTALTPAQQQADAQTQALLLQQKIEAIYNAWNPQSPQCRFQYYFYNLVDPNKVSSYIRPPNAQNDTLWEKAVRENPDPTCHVPVLAIGFDDLRTRVEAQSKKSDEHQHYLKDLKTHTESLMTQHTLSNSSRLLRAIVAQTQLSQRLLKFVQHLHLLIPSVRSSSIRPEEERLRSTLEEIEDELRRGRMKGKLNELWALLGAVNAAKERARTGTGEWAVVDEDGLAQLTQILSEQQSGLSHLTKILQKALKDVGIIMGTNTNSAQSDYEVDNLLSSTNTSRASAFR